MRGISLVRTIKVSEPNRKEPVYVTREFMVRCNASIPMSHKDFQNQYKQAVEVESFQAPVKKKHPKVNNQKLQKHKSKSISPFV